MNEHNTITWDDTYSIGIDSIDVQHKKLFTLVGRLYELEDGDEIQIKQKLKPILYDFSDYMKTHFQDEEAFMESINYPKLAEHQLIHQKIIDHLTDLIRTPASIGIIKTKMKVLAKKSLIDHITKEDIKIKNYILAQKAKSSNIDEEIFEIVSVQ